MPVHVVGLVTVPDTEEEEDLGSEMEAPDDLELPEDGLEDGVEDHEDTEEH